jgi:hypothetical protein
MRGRKRPAASYGKGRTGYTYSYIYAYLPVRENLRDAGNGRRSPAARPAAGYFRRLSFRKPAGNAPRSPGVRPIQDSRLIMNKKGVRSDLSEVGLHVRLEEVV